MPAKARRRQRPGIQAREGAADFTAAQVCPSDQSHPFVEEEIAAGVPLADHQRSQGFGTRLGGETPEVQVGQDIDIVDQEGASALQETAGVQDAASGLQQSFRLR